MATLARSTVEALGPLLKQLERSDTIDPPGSGDFCFYALTPGGRRTCRINAGGTAPRDGPEVKLIRLSGALLTEIRASAN